MSAALASLLIGLAAADSAPIRPISQWVHTRWSARDGAPEDVYAFAQTPDGTLWIGSLAGLIRFDGIRFVPFVPQAGDSVPVGRVDNLYAARDSSLWVVWRSGVVSRVRDGRMETWTPREGLPRTWSITESRSRTLVAATAAGLVSFGEGAWKNVSREWGYPGNAAKTAWFDRGDTLWVQTEDRVVYLPAGSSRFIDPGMITIRPGDHTAFAQAQDGTVWMAEIARSVHSVPRLGDRGPLSAVEVGGFALLFDRRGSLWIATAGDGLRRVIDPTRIRGRTVAQFGPEAEQFTEQDGLQSNIVISIFEDREGNIWAGTSRGVERFREGAFTPMPMPGSVRPRMVFATRDTMLWVTALNTFEIVRVGPGHRDTIGTDLVYPILVEDRAGLVWTVQGREIFQYRRGRFVPVPLGRSQANQLVNITVDTAGTLWVIDDIHGLFQLQGNSLSPVRGVPDGTAQGGTLFSDRNGRVWLGSPRNHTVVLFEKGAMPTTFDRAQGNGPEYFGGFFQDRAGTIWIYGPGGLSRFEGNRFRTQTERQGIPSRAVTAIAEDAEGAWWMTTRRGVVRVPAGEFDRALSDTGYTVKYRSFDQSDGLPGAIGEMVVRAADGRIWVATDSGVGVVDPRQLRRPHPPAARMEAARLEGRELLTHSGLTLPPRPGALEIDYTAATLSIPERVQFRYRLDGEDKSWQEVGTRRRAYYTGLGPGSYTFRVSASHGDGVWSDSAAVWSFRVLPAWYQTIWLRGAVVLLIGGLGGSGVAAVQRRRHHREQLALKSRYEATLAERARIAQELHDTLLQGFAGVSLQLKAAELALPEQPDVAAETLFHVQQLTRETLREARQRVLDLHEPELSSGDLASALESSARGMIGGTGIAFSLTFSGERRRLPPALEVAALRIGREAIANAIRHAEPRRIEVVVGFEPDTLRLEVRDDGRGFTPEQAERARREGHLGLTGMRDRAARAEGTCEIYPGSEGGTVVAVALPLGGGGHRPAEHRGARDYTNA